MPPAIITILIRCAAHHPQRGQQGKLGSPVGELSSKARLRGCCSLIGNSQKSPTAPPLPLRGTKQRYDCHRQSLYLDSLRGAPPPAGAARIPPHPTFIPQNRRNNWLHPTKNQNPQRMVARGTGRGPRLVLPESSPQLSVACCLDDTVRAKFGHFVPNPLPKEEMNGTITKNKNGILWAVPLGCPTL